MSKSFPLDQQEHSICTADSECHKPGAHQHNVPPKLLRRRTGLFCAKLVLAAAIIIATSAGMLSGSPPLVLLGMFVQGAIYVHLLELQHSVLHLHAFSSPKLSRVVGFLLGLPLFVSYSQYQYVHMGHHKWLGTKQNTETFSYQDGKLNSLAGFVRGMLDYSRLTLVLQRIYRSFAGGLISDGKNPVMEARIRQEHQLFGIALAVAILVSLLLPHAWPVMLWLLPLLFAEPVHFVMALPDHFGLPAHKNPNVFENTRTIKGTWFSHWYTNYSTLHMAHHYNMHVPIENMPELQRLLESQIPQSSRNESYPEFYLQVINGELKAESVD